MIKYKKVAKEKKRKPDKPFLGKLHLLKFLMQQVLSQRATDKFSILCTVYKKIRQSLKN